MHLPDDVLYGEHDAQRDVSLQHGSGRQHGDKYVLHFVDEHGAHLLPLSQIERAHVDAEQGSLDIFPFPPLLLLASQQLDVLHAVNQLHQVVLVQRHLLEVLPVQVGPFAHEEPHPAYVEQAEQGEYEEYLPAVDGKHHPEDGHGDGSEEYLQHRLCQETLYLVVVFDSSYQVACQLAVEELHGQAHQLGEEVGDERHVDPRADVQQDAAADYLDEGAAEHQHQLCRQYQPDEVQVPVTYTLVYDGLCQEGEHQLQDASCQQAHHQLHQGFPVGAHVVQQIPEREFLVLDGFRLIELRGDVNQQCDTFLLAGC